LRNNTLKLLKERSVPAWELSNTAWLEGVPRTWPDDAARKRLLEAFTNTFHVGVVSLTKDFSTDLWVVNLASPEVTKKLSDRKWSLVQIENNLALLLAKNTQLKS